MPFFGLGLLRLLGYARSRVEIAEDERVYVALVGLFVLSLILFFLLRLNGPAMADPTIPQRAKAKAALLPGFLGMFVAFFVFFP